MANDYGPAEIAAARAVIADANWLIAIHDETEHSFAQLDFISAATGPEFGWAAALDALERTQKEISDLRYTFGYCDEYRLREMARADAAEAVVARLTADHERQRDYLAALQTREAELDAEVARLKLLAAENASLLRRVESLRMAVWGENHGEKAAP